MKSFQDYLADLQEMPFVSSYITKNMIDKSIEDHDKLHLAAKSKSIGSDSFTYVSDTGITIYFRKNSKGMPEELNYVDKSNTQILAYKRNGTTKTIIDHMIYHIRKYGEIKTDSSQSPGAKHLWINFIKSNPKGISFESELDGSIIKLDSSNIADYQDRIWSSRKIRTAEIGVRAYVT
jgi:hypothetical protein